MKFFKTVVSLITLQLIEGKIPLKGYNEPCELYDTTSSCDDTIGLLCIDSGIKGYRCKCPTDKQFETIYDTSRNKCVGKAFNSCIRDPSSPPNVANSINSTLCVENAECNNVVYYMPICLCKKGFFETDGTCAPVAKYGEACDNDKAQCDLKNGLSCQPNGKCGCKEDSNNQFYDNQEEICITYVGGNCSLEENLCVDGAECRKLTNFPSQNIIPNSPHRRSIIFGSSEEGNQNSDISFSNRDRNTPTRYRPIRPSGLSGTSTTDSIAKCMCKPGYSETKGFCMKSYGSICRMMQQNGTEMCSSDQFLECLDGHDGHFRCQCRNPMNERWNDVKKKCFSMIGKKCRASPSYPECEDGAECLGGICQCKRGTSLTPIGGCKLDYNERCQPGQCNLFSGLACHGKTGTCLCLDSYLKYDSKKKSCVAEMDSPCGNVDLIGFQGRGMQYYQFSESGNGNRLRNGQGDVPFIGCTDGAICSPMIPGNRMSHKCVIGRP